MNALELYLVKAAIKSGIPTDAFYLAWKARNEVLYGDSLSGTPQDTRELINSYIPTFDEIGESYLFEQVVQEGVSHVLGVTLWWPVKLGLEAYSLYDYFDE